MTEKQCKICGRVFQARQSNYLCCSAECRQINWNITHQKALANMTESQKEDRRRKMREYFRRKKDLVPEVMRAYDTLSAQNDVIVIEGAGSPAEINLKKT